MEKDKETMVSYINLKVMGDKLSEFCSKDAESHLKLTQEAILGVFSKLVTLDEKGAEKVVKEITEKEKALALQMVEELSGLVGDFLVEAYEIGFIEGAESNVKGNDRTLRKLIENGVIEDDNGQLVHYLDTVRAHHQAVQQKHMQGKTLNVYSFDKPKKEEQ